MADDSTLSTQEESFNHYLGQVGRGIDAERITVMASTAAGTEVNTNTGVDEEDNSTTSHYRDVREGEGEGDGDGEGEEGEEEGEEGDEEEDDAGDEDEDDEEEEDELVVLERLQETFVKAKACVSLSQKGPSKKGKRSETWNYFFVCTIKSTARRKQLEILDNEAYKKLTGGNPYCCHICYNDVTKPLNEGAINLAGDHAGNATTHLENVHGIEVAKNTRKRKQAMAFAKQASVTSKGAKAPGGAQAPGGVVPKKKKRTDSASNSTLTSRNENTPVKSIVVQSPTSPYQIVGRANVVAKHHDNVFNFVNNSNVSVRSVTDPRANQDFVTMCDFMIDYGGTLKHLRSNRGGLHMGVNKFSRTRREKLEFFFAAAAAQLEEIKAIYRKLLKKDDFRCFIMAQDEWDAKFHKIFGVTIFAYNPVRNAYFILPIGLIHIEKGTALFLARKCILLMERVGLKPTDIMYPVNDTCNTAIKTGRDAIGKEKDAEKENDGTCTMHSGDLIMEHAMGICSRKKKKVITDKFEEAERLRKDIRKSASHLMNKKAKTRFKTYQQMMETHSRKHRRLYLPNKTRVGGTHRMYLCLLISRWNLRVYYYSNPSVPQISNEDFIRMSEMEAVIWPARRLSKLVQTDTFGAISYTYFYIFETWASYTLKKQYHVAQVDDLSDFAKEAQNKWDGGGRMAPRHLWNAPDNDKEGLSTVWLVKRKVVDMYPVAQQLISRFINEFTRYCLKMTKQKMLAMACNPLSATIVMLELDLFVKALRTSGGEICKPFLKDFRQEAKDALREQIYDTCSELIPQDGAEETPIVVVDDEDDPLGALRAEQHNKRTDSGDEDENKVDAEIKRFFNQNINWNNQLKTKNVKKDVLDAIGDTTKQYQKNIPMIAEHFDVMTWWFEIGKNDFPLIHLVASMVLACPDSNGHQERTFSACTWMDDPLKRSTHGPTFEMKALLYRNKDFLDKYAAMALQDQQRTRAAAATRTLLNQKQIKVTAEERSVQSALRKERNEEETDSDDEDAAMIAKAMAAGSDDEDSDEEYSDL